MTTGTQEVWTRIVRKNPLINLNWRSITTFKKKNASLIYKTVMFRRYISVSDIFFFKWHPSYIHMQIMTIFNTYKLRCILKKKCPSALEKLLERYIKFTWMAEVKTLTKCIYLLLSSTHMSNICCLPRQSSHKDLFYLQ